MASNTFVNLVKKSKHIYNVTHVADFDGMASAAMLVHYANLHENDIIFGGPSTRETKAYLKELNSLKIHDSLIVFTDITINQEDSSTLYKELGTLRKHSNRIVWIDHHPWNNKVVRKIKPICDFFISNDSKHCAAELVYRMLNRQDGYGNLISKIAHFGDFNLYSRKHKNTLMNMARAITFINYRKDNKKKLRKVVKLIAQNKLKDEFIIRNARNYQNDAIKNVNQLKRTSKLANVNGYKIGIGYANRLQSTHACSVIQKLFDTDIEIFINLSSSSMHLRSREGIDSSVIAAKFGGGGHKKASGAPTNARLSSPSDIASFTKSLIKTAELELPEYKKNVLA